MIMSEVGHLVVFLSHLAQNMLFLAINMLLLVVMHLFPLYMPGNRLKHLAEGTILKVVLKIVPCSQTHIVHITHSELAQPILPSRSSFYSSETLNEQKQIFVFILIKEVVT